MKEKQSFLKHFLVIGSGTIFNMIVSFITIPIITRLVGPVEYGQYSIFTMYTGIALMVLCLGLDQALIRFFFKNEDIDYKRTILLECWWIPILVTIFVGILVNVLSFKKIIIFEFDSFIMLMMTVSVLFQVFNRVDLILLRVTYQTKLYSILQVVFKTSFAVLALLGCYFFKAGYFYILIIATVISYILVVTIGISAQRDLWFFWKRKKTFLVNKKELYMYAFPYIISMGITTLFQAIDKIFLNYYTSYTEVGIYASAMTIVNILAIIQSTFNAMWIPTVTEHYETNPEDKEFHKRGNRLITVVMFFIGLSLIFMSDVFSLLLGVEYREAAYILPFLIFNPLMLTISETTVVGLIFKNKSKMHIVIAAISCGVNILGNAWLVPLYGPRGAAISTGASYIVFFFMRTYFSNCYYPIDWKLGKFWFVVFVSSMYAWYNTFNSFNLMTVIGYIGSLLFLFVSYKDAVKEIILIVKKICKI